MNCPRWPHLPLCASAAADAEPCEGCADRTGAAMRRTDAAAQEAAGWVTEAPQEATESARRPVQLNLF